MGLGEQRERERDIYKGRERKNRDNMNRWRDSGQEERERHKNKGEKVNPENYTNQKVPVYLYKKLLLAEHKTVWQCGFCIR